MKHLLFRLAVPCWACLLYSCTGDPQNLPSSPTGTRIITHYNVVIVPDLSNRLKGSAVLPDTGIVRALVQDIYPRIATSKRSVNQKDRFQVVLSSKKLGALYHADFSRMTIDLGAFKEKQRDRIEYLTGNTSGPTLKKDAASFIEELARIEGAAKQQPDGADIWSFFNTGIDGNLTAAPDSTPFMFADQRFQNRFRNILILLTDGYIEAGLYGAKGCEGKQCCYLSGQRIGQFRQAYQQRTDKKESLSSFFCRNAYGITTANNSYLKDFEVLVLEINDRSLSPSGNATAIPTDYEIIRLFWEDWLKKSGVPHFELHPLSRDAHEAEQNILSFMGIK